MPADTEQETVDAAGTVCATDPAGARVVEPWEALGTELLVDEEHVKCWVERVAPGETRPAHTHLHPWITVVVSGASGESRTPEGELISVGSAATGDVRFNGPDRLPFSHYLANTSDETLVMVAVELRGPAASLAGTTAGTAVSVPLPLPIQFPSTSPAAPAADSPPEEKD